MQRVFELFITEWKIWKTDSELGYSQRHQIVHNHPLWIHGQVPVTEHPPMSPTRAKGIFAPHADGTRKAVPGSLSCSLDEWCTNGTPMWMFIPNRAGMGVYFRIGLGHVISRAELNCLLVTGSGSTSVCQWREGENVILLTLTDKWCFRSKPWFEVVVRTLCR